MSYDPIENAMEAEFERKYKLRAAICRKYAEQFWDELNAGAMPNLSLIINDAIGEAIEAHLRNKR